MGFAVLHGAAPYNPVKAVRKPRQLSRTVRPLAPQTVEAIRRRLSLRDATLVSVLAYAGLRPERGARAALVERPQTHRPDRGLGLLRARENDEDQRHPQRPPPQPARG